MDPYTLVFGGDTATLGPDFKWSCADADLCDSLNQDTEISLLETGFVMGDPRWAAFRRAVDWLKPEAYWDGEPEGDPNAIH